MGRTVREKIDPTDLRRLHDVVLALVDRRTDLGLTQAELADRMEVTQSAVSELERMIVYPATTTLLRWVRALEGEASINLDFT